MTECWPWTGHIDQYGYGITYLAKKNRKAHRLAYEARYGPIPEGLTVDHLCHNASESCPGGNSCLHRRCVNPDHLEAVPSKVNTLRGKTITAANSKKTHCPQGHEYTQSSTYAWMGKRVCRICQTRRSKECRERLERGEREFHPGPKTHCKHGHEFTESNTSIQHGARVCRSCGRAACLRNYYKKKHLRSTSQ